MASSSLQHILKELAQFIPGFRSVVAERDRLRAQIGALGHPPGHFYSPIPSRSDIEDRFARLHRAESLNIPGVDLCLSEQTRWLEVVSSYYHECPFQESKAVGLRYYYSNNMFRHSDAIFLFGILRALQPRRIVEVGSGFSSALMLDTIDRFFPAPVQMTFIEPHPQRLESLLTESDKKSVTILRSQVQKVSSAPWQDLGSGDILFVDSSHVSKCGSDVHFLFSEVLPTLKDGVIIHFHDISFPFEYPEGWFTERNWAWNEAYHLHAFLQYNAQFRIIAWVHLLNRFFAEQIARDMPCCRNDSGGSIWIEKRSPASPESGQPDGPRPSVGSRSA